MNNGLNRESEKGEVNKGLLVAVLIAVLLVAGGLFVIWRISPSMEEQQQQVLVGAVREGTPEFEALTKRIIAENNEDKTWDSPLGTGFIMMNIVGKIRNNSDKPITGLELKVSVLDSFGNPVRDKILTVVPTQQAKLEPKKEMEVTVRMDGFSKDDDRARIQWKVTAIKTEN